MRILLFTITIISFQILIAAPMVLNVGNSSEPRDLDPHLCSGGNETRITLNLFEGLVSKDPRDLKILPGVADSWKISKDGMKLNFHLRKTALWTDGRKVTAHDFVYAWKRLLTPATAAEFSSFGFHFKNGREFYEGRIKDISQVGFKALDESNLEIILENPSLYFLALLAQPSLFPISQMAVDKFGTRWSRPENIITNGPFIVEKWKSNQVMVLKKNVKYWDAKQVKPDQVNVHFISKSDTEEKLFRAGELDVTAQIPIEKIPFWENDKSRVLQKHPYLGTYYYWLNTQKIPLDNKLVRKALNLAVDRTAITHKVTLVKQIAAQFFTPPGTGGFQPKGLLPANGAEIKRAQSLLAEAGYPEGKGFPKLELLYNTDEGHRKIAEAIAQMWKVNLGIDVTLVNQEWKVLLDNQNLKNFTILRSAWIADYNDPNSFLEIFQSGHSNNYGGWSNVSYDEKIKQAAKEIDNRKRMELFQAAENILLEELPVVPIYIYTRVYLKKTRLEGWYPNIEDYRPFKWAYLK